MKKKIVISIFSLTLILCCVIGGTFAWLKDVTDPVQNTFTYGDINIELTETDSGQDSDEDDKTNSYKMVPGNTISKDPKVTIKAGSEACYVFVEIVEGGSVTVNSTTYTFDDFLSYAIAEGWNVKDQNTVNADGGENGNDKVVIYRAQSALTAEGAQDVTFNILKGDATYANGKVTVKDTVTKEMMNAIDGIDSEGKTGTPAANAELAARPTLTFTAYAVQSDNVTDWETAWAIAKQ